MLNCARKILEKCVADQKPRYPPNEKNLTPLHVAIENGFEDMVDLFLNDPYMFDLSYRHPQSQDTVLHFASEEHRIYSFIFLILIQNIWNKELYFIILYQVQLATQKAVLSPK